ncbi:protein phosphatase 2C domain-containing protein [Marinicella sp. S1101]|uniref:PP2C family protein-serine/threonine phosphatase n=1 Tax=Marinicella marina TaxID=2996016 RepID=UPI002260F558|nr:protein phosphatase 2C domain-containing protein [Marinicella marina]MCX7553494.1 protein phosphatase 2C domain-containing protein [Marinicella marina]MDJ1140118.1 protein phosphatase 2C domain-containing protein [Marinicella marina]
MNIILGHTSHSGIKRDHNEDTYGIDLEHGLFLVADGMGGHDHGEIASALARDNILSSIKNDTPIRQAILDANQEIINSSLEKPGDLPMGTTIAILKVNNDEFECAWVGDSRVYKFTNNQLQPISSDHSYVQELVDQELITASQARSHPHRNVVTQALGVTDNSEIKISLDHGNINPGDKFLICSDGLTEEVDDERIAQIISKSLSPKEIGDQLMVQALENGGSDNITAIVLEFVN